MLKQLILLLALLISPLVNARDPCSHSLEIEDLMSCRYEIKKEKAADQLKQAIESSFQDMQDATDRILNDPIIKSELKQFVIERQMGYLRTNLPKCKDDYCIINSNNRRTKLLHLFYKNHGKE